MKVFDEAYRKKLSDAQRKLWANPKYRIAQSKAFSEGHKGTTKPEWVKKKIADAQIGVPKLTSGVRGARHHNWNPEKSEFKVYLREVHRLTSRIYTTYKGVINPENHLRTKCGVKDGYQLDHKVSVKEGFEKKIPASEIAHINNLQMLSWKENRAKGA